MFRTTTILLRLAAFLAVASAALLSGCADRVTSPEDVGLSNKPARGRVEQPFRIQDPDQPVAGLGQ